MPKVVDRHQRKTAFIRAAFRVISKQGLSKLTVRAISKEAGYTTGGLVHYFKSKDHVLIEASEYSTDLLRERLQHHEDTRVGLDALRHTIYETLPSTNEMRGMWNIRLGFWDRAPRNKQVRAIIEGRYAEWHDRLVRLIKQAQARGEIARSVDPTQTSQTIASIVDGIGVRVLLTRAKMPAARQRQLIDTFIENLPRPPKRKAGRAKRATRPRASGSRSTGSRARPKGRSSARRRRSESAQTA